MNSAQAIEFLNHISPLPEGTAIESLEIVKGFPFGKLRIPARDTQFGHISEVCGDIYAYYASPIHRPDDSSVGFATHVIYSAPICAIENVVCTITINRGKERRIQFEGCMFTNGAIASGKIVEEGLYEFVGSLVTPFIVAFGGGHQLEHTYTYTGVQTRAIDPSFSSFVNKTYHLFLYGDTPRMERLDGACMIPYRVTLTRH